jgi:hypothetical protein
MEGGTKSAGNGIGCGTVLFFIFLTLKLTHYIDWSWLWVFAPLWIPLALVALLLGTVFVCSLARR